jgi:TetR/AcrR family transcriptional regulator, repressor for neighboring sulfatase
MLDTPNVPDADSNHSRPAGRTEVVDAALDAATDLFATHNPSQVSVRDIAAQAGVSHALIHRYLGSKEDILHAVLERASDRAAESWLNKEGHGHPSGAFDYETPAGRYIRTVIRARLDGFELSSDELRFPHADEMMAFTTSRHYSNVVDEGGFNPQVVFATAIAVATGMGIAEEFFLVQAGIENEDRDQVRAEVNRLIMRLMTLADRPTGDA